MYKLQFFTFIFAVLLLQNIFKVKKAGHVNLLALYGVYLTKKKEVISFARSKVTERVPNINCRSRDPDHDPSAGHSCSSAYSTRRGLSTKEKTKCLSLPVQKLRRGSQNLKSGSRDSDHTPLGGHSCSPV